MKSKNNIVVPIFIGIAAFACLIFGGIFLLLNIFKPSVSIMDATATIEILPTSTSQPPTITPTSQPPTDLPTSEPLVPTFTLLPTQTPFVEVTPSSQLALVRFDGLYASEKREGSSWYYFLRFYEDGVVLTYSSEYPYAEKAVRVNKISYTALGTYVILESTIIFTTVNPQGNVDYNGFVSGEKITLDSYSHINENEMTRIYHFMEIPNME